MVAGCTAAYISRIEAGERIPSYQLMMAFGKLLGVSADFLATGAEGDAATATLAEAELATRLGEIDRAAELYEEILAGDPSPLHARMAHRGQAEHALLRGDHRLVVELLEPLREDARTDDEQDWIADRLGRAYAHLGEYEQSLAVIERAFASARERGDDPATLRFAILLANALLDGGNPARAEEVLAVALNIADGLNNPVDLARVWWSQSRLHIRAGRQDVAARYAQKAIDLLDVTEHSSFAAAAYQLLAHIENDRGRSAEALAFVERGQPAAERSGDRYVAALFELERVRALAGLGDTTEALSRGMGLAGVLGDIDPSDSSRCYSELAKTFRDIGERERALELYELAAERLGESDPYRADILTGLGELLEEAGKTGEAMAVYKQAAQIRASTPSRSG